MGWNATKPAGVEGDNLMKVMETFAHVLSRNLQNHVTDGEVEGRFGYENAYLKSARPELGIPYISYIYIIYMYLKHTQLL